ncbi:MAG: 4-(cytidine 5'-diphospho)-2-C-methyl-D-erythritol kinase [Saccharofermentans sp.]|nr:4-(cytidine 5'-diphospho)-2-C-methyl-D-erythritol kinase [Saccharofermentans sp.]
MILSSKANAKINLFLKICGLLPEGYHRLYMLMQEISLGDEISIEFGEPNSNPIINIVSQADCPPEKDLCYRAAKAFYDEYSARNAKEQCVLCDITITENKVTPSQAGLGGGSSDAATVLKLLSQYYNNPFSQEELIEMSVGLGADVPFFIVGGSAICEGIGEVITPLPSLKDLPLLLVKPAEGVPTGPCFKLSDSKNRTFDEDAYRSLMNGIFDDANMSAMDRIKAASSYMVNDLQDPAMELVPVIGEVITELKKTAPVFCAMSGSGSCVFAIYDSVENRDKALNGFNKDAFPDCFILGCQTL